jgi:5'-methylthioadenosine phosphorylase
MATKNQTPVLDIIGGSGVYDIEGLPHKHWERVHSPFGCRFT